MTYDTLDSVADSNKSVNVDIGRIIHIILTLCTWRAGIKLREPCNRWEQICKIVQTSIYLSTYTLVDSEQVFAPPPPPPPDLTSHPAPTLPLGFHSSYDEHSKYEIII